MYLSGDDDQLMVGNFMGDFVKGPLGHDFPQRVRQGLVLHRKIDSFAQRDISFQASRLRLSPHFGLYRGVLVDLFYDHFLAVEWERWSDIPFPDYMASSRSGINRYQDIMPPSLQEFVPVIFDELLPSYASVSGIESALQRMSRRVIRSNPLATGATELILHYDELKADFEQFMVDVGRFTKDLINCEALT
jgi:acyl carrier protein phosphodiesterase